MTILVLGGHGQLGSALQATGRVTVVGREVDITSGRAIGRALAQRRPSVVVNAAAWTNVDGAERCRREAFAANGLGPGLIAEACHRVGVPLIHISTDYVFDGSGGAPYAEDAPVSPVNAYGASKLAGELAVRAATPQHVILRTAWVISGAFPGFCRAILGRARHGGTLRVVDQAGNPTPNHGLAQAVLAVVDALPTEPWGTFHIAGGPTTTWHGLAEALIATAGDRAPVGCIPTASWPAKATRPLDTRLDTRAFTERFGVTIDWRDHLQTIVDEARG